MTLNIVFSLSVLFVMGFVGLSAKPLPVYGGSALIVIEGIGCAIVLSFGGSFLGLMVFLVYLGGMMVVFGYTTAMATEEYPKTWGSNVIIWGSLLLGLFMELLLFYWWVKHDQIEIVVEFNNVGEWVIYDDEGGVGFLWEDSIGVVVTYICNCFFFLVSFNFLFLFFFGFFHNCWLMVVAGWLLFVGIFIAIEIILGNKLLMMKLVP